MLGHHSQESFVGQANLHIAVGAKKSPACDELRGFLMQKQKILLMCNKGKRATSTLVCVRSGKCVKHDLVSSTSGSLEKLGLLPADLRQSSPGESLPTAEPAGSGPPAGDRPHVDRALESAGGDERGKSPGSPPPDGRGETADDN